MDVWSDWKVRSVSALAAKPQAAPEPVPVCSRQAPETVTPGTVATAGYPPDRGHQGVMRSDEPGIAAAPKPEPAPVVAHSAKPACAFPVAAVDRRLGAWR